MAARMSISTLISAWRLGVRLWGKDVPACEMAKWFDTNYHYIVPEFSAQQDFLIASHTLFSHVNEAHALGHTVKPVLVGPLTYLWLGKTRPDHFDKLTLLDRLLPAYGEILQRLKQQGVSWVQIDEPILALELPLDWQRAFESAYTCLQVPGLKRLVATYFGALRENTQLVCRWTACTSTWYVCRNNCIFGSRPLLRRRCNKR